MATWTCDYCAGIVDEGVDCDCEASRMGLEFQPLVDELLARTATRWSLVGELADVLLAGENESATDWFEHQSPEFKDRFWKAYSELELSPLGIDDSTPEYETLFSDDSDYFDSEWLARRPLVRTEKASRGNIGADSAVAELNRGVAREARLATRARRLHEALIVHDRRKVVVVWPTVAFEADSAFNSKIVDEPNTRKWFGSVREAEEYVTGLSVRLAHRGVPVRVWEPVAA